ncbi:MAG: T9SS type A sorting domain-containing protein [Bacteroidetes bacterium]|nr:T9SS type A sorting domain-containing protein [Bacteroidota bacterium]
MINFNLAKRNLLASIASLLLAAAATTATAQCPTGDVVFSTQAEVNAFGTSYPNCATMNGSLFIGVTTGSSNITDISALSGLTTVPGYISIDNNGQLQNLNGLQGLVSIGFHLQVYNNDQLTDVSALDDLKTVGSYFKIEDNAALTNLNGFSALEVVGDNFTIRNNASLQTINGFANLDSIKGGVELVNNVATQSINGFGNVKFIGAHLAMQNNNALQSFGGFSQTRSIGSDVFIGYNPMLQTITGFTSLNAIGGYLSIGANAALQNLNAFSNLTTIGTTLGVTDNATLNDISGLQNTTFQPFNGNGLGIANNPQLSLCNLPNFCAYLANPATTHPRTISGNATTCATEQDVITACQTPAPCPTSDVTLATQAEVNAFGTNHSTCTAINGSLFIGVNAGTSDITDLSPLAGIQTVSGYVWVANNSGLQNLNGLHNISNVGGALNITGNATLQNLNGLSSLTTVGQDIYVVENSTLTNISALQSTAFTPASGFGLTLRDNTLLEVCNYPNFCAYIANDATTHPRVISGNATTCATEQALQAACLSIGINDMGQTVVNAYPNPVKDVLNISTDLSITEVAVMNMLGQTLVAKQGNTTIVQVDMSMLPAGNYIVKVTTANGAQVGKVTKQ